MRDIEHSQDIHLHSRNLPATTWVTEAAIPGCRIPVIRLSLGLHHEVGSSGVGED